MTSLLFKEPLLKNPIGLWRKSVPSVGFERKLRGAKKMFAMLLLWFYRSDVLHKQLYITDLKR